MLKNKIKGEVKEIIESRVNNGSLDEYDREKIARDLAAKYADKSDHDFGTFVEFILEILVEILI
ncbi:hypothetical protein IZY60_13105 [Lutibacter sp. B2]|nr:hypothetical protein [Lutibacter sp. B2]